MEEQLTAKEAAEFLGVSVSFIRNAKQKEKVAYTQIGARYTFTKEALLTLINKFEPQNNANECLE